MTASSENFVSIEQVAEAALRMDLIPLDAFSIDVGDIVGAADIVGRMTGLDMSKYDVVLNYDRRGRNIVRRRAIDA